MARWPAYCVRNRITLSQHLITALVRFILMFLSRLTLAPSTRTVLVGLYKGTLLREVGSLAEEKGADGCVPSIAVGISDVDGGTKSKGNETS